jgi:hypothetical protein
MRRILLLIILVGTMHFTWLGSGRAGTQIVPIRYQPVGKLFFLLKKTGSTLAVCPFKDKRPDQHHIGHSISDRHVTTYFESAPSPLERAMREVLAQSFSRSGLRIVPILNWDGVQESLNSIETDSALKVDIERFWIEGRVIPRGINLSASIDLTFHLGLKKEGKMLTQRAYSSKQRTFTQWRPESAELMINQALTEILDAFFFSLR